MRGVEVDRKQMLLDTDWGTCLLKSPGLPGGLEVARREEKSNK